MGNPDYNKPIDPDTVAEICRLKTEEDLTVKEIAEVVGVSEASVLRYLARNGISHKKRPVRDTDPLTEEQFDTLKQKKEKGANSYDVSVVFNVPLIEANSAWAAPDYEYYLRNR